MHRVLVTTVWTWIYTILIVLKVNRCIWVLFLLLSVPPTQVPQKDTQAICEDIRIIWCSPAHFKIVCWSYLSSSHLNLVLGPLNRSYINGRASQTHVNTERNKFTSAVSSVHDGTGGHDTIGLKHQSCTLVGWVSVLSELAERLLEAAVFVGTVSTMLLFNLKCAHCRWHHTHKHLSQLKACMSFYVAGESLKKDFLNIQYR